MEYFHESWDPVHLCYDKTRQLTAENAFQEMYITENGPMLVRADKLLTRACDSCWKSETKEGNWHYITDNRRSYFVSSLAVMSLENMSLSLHSWTNKYSCLFCCYKENYPVSMQ